MRNDSAIQESKNVKSPTNRIKKILDAKHKKANLKEVTTKSKYLNSDKQVLIYRLSKTQDNMFDGTLGKVLNIKLNF